MPNKENMDHSIEALSCHTHHIPDISAAFHRQWSHLVPGKSLEDVENSVRLRTNTDKLPMAFVAVDGEGEWIGTVSLKMHDLDTRNDLSPWLASLFVKEEHRRRGVGKSLMERACERAKSLGISDLYLYTDLKEGFYRTLGWALAERQNFHGQEIATMTLSLI